MDNIANLIISVNSQQVTTATNNLNQLAKASDSALTYLKSLITIAAAMTVFKNAADAIGEFQKQLSVVKSVTDGSEADMKTLTEAAREFGLASQYSASQAAEGMKFLGQAGFNTKQILATMPGLLNLAAAGELQLGEAADITASMLAGFQLSAKDATKVADTLAVAANATQTDVRGVGEAMKYVAPIASTLGLSLNETASAIGLLSSANIKGSEAGTALRSIIGSLVSPSREAAAAMRVYGIEQDNVNPKTHSLIEIFEELRKHGLDATGAFDIFGQRAVSAVLALTSRTADLKTLNGVINSSAGAAAKYASVMSDNLPGDITKAKNAINDLFLSIGDAGLTKALREGTQGVTNFTTQLSILVKSGEAAAWLDYFELKFNHLFGDIIQNGLNNVSDLWAMTMEYMTGTGKDAANDISNAFKNMPENIKAAMQLAGASWGVIVLYAEATGKAAWQALDDYLKLMVSSATNAGKAIGQALNPFSKGTFSFADAEKKSIADFVGSSVRNLLDLKNGIVDATNVWEDQVAAILNNRDAEIKAGDDKLEMIRRLREAYKKLLEARALANAKPGAADPGIPKGGGVDETSSHFDTQAFDALRQGLQSEEEAVNESYQRRKDLILKNTQNSLTLRNKMLGELDAAELVEMDKAKDAHFQRLTDQYTADQNALQSNLDNKLISEETFQEQSQGNWKKYQDSIQGISVGGLRQMSMTQMNMMNNVLGMGADLAQRLQGMAAEGTAAQKALFAVSKAIAFAQTLIMTNLAATAVMAPPPMGMGMPAGAGYATAIKIMGYASAAAIAAQTFITPSTHDHGGMIPGGSFGIVGENGPEIVRGPAVVTSTRQTADMGNKANGNNINFVVNMQVPNAEVTDVKRSQNSQGETIEFTVKKAVRAVASDIAGGDGPVSKAMASSFGNLRRGL